MVLLSVLGDPLIDTRTFFPLVTGHPLMLRVDSQSLKASLSADVCIRLERTMPLLSVLGDFLIDTRTLFNPSLLGSLAL